MTVLRIPVRVRLDLAADRVGDPDLPGTVADLAGTALSRAVDRARAVPLVRAANRVEIAPPYDTRFTGDALPRSVATALDATLHAVVDAATVRLAARPTAPTDGVDGAADGRDREEADADRIIATPTCVDGESYLVPAYHGRGRPVAVELQRRAPRPPPVRMVRRLHRFGSAQELRDALVVRYGGDVPSQVAVLARTGAGRPAVWLVTMGPDQQIQGEPRYLGMVREFLPAIGTGAALERYVSVYETDTLAFRYRASTAGERLQRRTELLLDKLREGSPAPEDQLRRQAGALARQIPRYDGPSMYFELRWRTKRIETLEIDTGDLPERDIPAAAFSDRVAVPLDGSPPRAYGSNCPPLDAGVELPGWLALFGFARPEVETRETAFLSEPPVESWPSGLYATFQSMIEEIAGLLQMAPTRFVGSFLISAMARVDQACRPLGAVQGNGEGGESPRFAVLRRLASAFGPMARLAELYTRSLAAFDAAQSLPCPLAGQTASWLLHFYETYFSARESAVASMFVATCQDTLLDVLETSHREIRRRQENFPAYMRVTRLLLVVLLAETMDLVDLRRSLIENDPTAHLPMVANPVTAWELATTSLIDLYTASTTNTDGPPESGRVAYRDSAYRVQDATGRWWTRPELDAVIATGRQEALGIDPMLEKLDDMPDVVHRLRFAQQRDAIRSTALGSPVSDGVDAEFATLLKDLRAENEKRTRDVRDDRDIAFGMASFTESEIRTAADIGAKLAGIHKLADDKLRPLFGGDPAYVEGMRALAASEIGKAEFWEFFNLVGLAALAVFCPAAAFLIGAAEALHGLDTALEHRGIQRAMLGGDEIITQAQAEAELWGAAIGVALAFLPEVGTLARGTAGGVKAAVKGELREAAAAAAAASLRRAAVHLAEVAAQGFVKAFVKEAVTGYVLNYAIGAVIGRVTDAVARDVETFGGGSILNLGDIVSQAIAGRPTPEPARAPATTAPATGAPAAAPDPDDEPGGDAP